MAEKVHPCRECFNYTDAELCPVCCDTKRDASLICVVETPRDVGSFERAGSFRGRYHVLGGADWLRWMGWGPDRLTFDSLRGGEFAAAGCGR